MKKIFTLCFALLASVLSFAASGDVQNIPTTADNPFDCSAVVFDQVTYNANWNGNNIDYIGKHDVVSFNINNTKETAYKITFKYSTILDGMTVDLVINDASGKEVFKTTVNTPSTSGGANDWSNYVDAESDVTPVLPAGAYKFYIYYGEGTWQGGENPFACNINNIAFVETAAAGGGTAPAGKTVTLSVENLDKATSTSDVYLFTDAEDFALGMEGRDPNRNPRTWTLSSTGQEFTPKGLNFKNNAVGTIMIPAGKQVVKLEMGGDSESAAGNLCYLYKVDVDGTNVFTEAIGQDVKENATIESSAKYPIYPDGTDPLFATIDFATPATNTIAVQFSGNNQENVWFRLTLAGDTTAIETVETVTVRPADNTVYNLRGQRVDASYKGIVIKNGKKYFQK